MNKILVALMLTSFSGLGYAGVTAGGGSGTSLVVGDIIVQPSEFIKTAEGGLALDKYRLIDVMAESMSKNKSLEFNGEVMAVDVYDFKTGRLSLRSLSPPSHIITIESASWDSEVTE